MKRINIKDSQGMQLKRIPTMWNMEHMKHWIPLPHKTVHPVQPKLHKPQFTASS